MKARWQAALGYALTGCELQLAETGRPDPHELVEGLDAAGWPASRVAEHAAAQVAAEIAWPQHVPAALRAGCGAAQFSAALGLARELLHLTTIVVRAPSGRLTLNPEEERLMREVPPHHGS